MTAQSITLMMLALLLPLAAYLAFTWFRIFNSAEGERYMKRRMQGPFVPLSAKDSADDAARSKEPGQNSST